MARTIANSQMMLLLVVTCCAALCPAQDAVLRGSIVIQHQTKKLSGSGDAVVWLTPYEGRVAVQPGPMARLVQKNKQFLPHLLAITAGTTVEFPNRDPFFHDVFSIYHGRPFDLGLYESGTARKVVFTKPGVSFIFCNIHPEMSAVVLVLQTPYFAQTESDGHFHIAHLPPGRYKLEVWHELGSASELASLGRDVEIAAGDNSLAAITVHSADTLAQHSNKYGEAYSADKNSY
jgi:plastocyanin